MGSAEQGRDFFARYGLQDVHRFGDPDGSLYRAFGLARVPFWVLFNPKLLRRGLESFRAGHRQGMNAGDAFRMPGVFLLYKCKVVRAYRHESMADRPDYLELACPTSHA